MPTNEVILSREPYITYVEIGETMLQVWFSHTGCHPEFNLLTKMKAVIECASSGDVIIGLEHAPNNLIEVMVSPRITDQETVVKDALKLITLTLRASCAHCKDYDPKFEPWYGSLTDLSFE